MEKNWNHIGNNIPAGIEVLGYNEKWIHEDYNPSGVRVCFRDDLSGWISAVWNNSSDTYQNCEE